MTITDKEATELQHQKHELMLKHDKGLISDKVFKEYYNDFERRIKERNKFVIEQYLKENKIKEAKEVKLEKVKKSTIRKHKRQPKKGSLASFVEHALLSEETKSIKDVVKAVRYMSTDKSDESIERMTKNVIRAVKAQKQPRWLGYTWNEEKFLLIK